MRQTMYTAGRREESAVVFAGKLYYQHNKCVSELACTRSFIFCEKVQYLLV